MFPAAATAMGFTASVGGAALVRTTRQRGAAVGVRPGVHITNRALARDLDLAHKASGKAEANVASGIALGRREALFSAAAAVVAVASGPAAAAERPGYNQGSFGEATNDEQLLELNRRIQELNKAPQGFPAFIREGYDVRVLVDDDWVKQDNGLFYLDYEVGEGITPSDGQEVTFEYTAYNESGGRIDSSFQKGQPARTQLGIGGLIPGFEEGLKSMRVGGKRRIIVPPDLGPPTGPSTFFSAKQFEVFDVELKVIKNCERQQNFMFSNVVCTDL